MHKVECQVSSVFAMGFVTALGQASIGPCRSRVMTHLLTDVDNDGVRVPKLLLRWLAKVPTLQTWSSLCDGP